MLSASILPRPQEFRPADGVCHLADLRRCTVSGLQKGTLEQLAQDFPDVQFSCVTRELPCAVFGVSNDDPRSTDLPAQASGNVIRVTATSIALLARDPEGLWMAFQTLYMLVQEYEGHVPCGVIRDWPAIQRRGIHIDLKGYQPKFSRLLEMVRLLGRYKINTILLELEDKFAYSSAPEVGVACAFTAEQMAELSQLCTDCFIELIPKLQSLGHVDYVLKHPRYAHLRENGHAYQYCPRHPEVFPLWRGMAKELMACFPGHRYFHIGADETTHLGECEICRNHSKSSAYIEQVDKCLDFVASQNRQPIMWDDILRNLHGHLSDEDLRKTWVLGEKAILMYWGYGYGGKNNAFPMLPEYRAKGMRVWGASGFSGCGPSWFQNVPPLRERALNIDAWTESAVEHHLEGVIATSWTRVVSFYPPSEIPEACWIHMIYAADSMWNGRRQEMALAANAAAKLFFGTELPAHVDFLADLDAGKVPPRPGTTTMRQLDRFELLCAAIACSSHESLRQHGWLNIYEILHAHHGRFGEAVPDYATKLFRERLDRFSNSLDTCEGDMERHLNSFYEDATVAETLQSRFGRDHQLLKEFASVLT